MHNLAPSTLLKLMSQRTEDKVRDLRAYDDPSGGYDAHRLLRLAVRRGLAAGSIDNLHSSLMHISVEKERANALKLEATLVRKLEAEGADFIQAPRAKWVSPRGTFGVEFHPEIGIQHTDHRFFAFLYATKQHKPSPTSAGALVLLARRALSAQLEPLDEVAVIDLINGRTFKHVNNTSEELLAKEIADLDAWFGGREAA